MHILNSIWHQIAVGISTVLIALHFVAPAPAIQPTANTVGNNPDVAALVSKTAPNLPAAPKPSLPENNLLPEPASSVAKTTVSNDAIVPTNQSQVTSPPPQNSTLCNGTQYSSCTSGDFVCPANGTAFCQPSAQQIQQQNQIQAAAYQAQQDAANRAQQEVVNQAQIRYQNQLQVVQVKVNALKPIYDRHMNACPNLSVVGSAAVVCESNAGQAQAVAEYQNAIMDNFLTPVTELSLEYENRLDDLSKQIYETKMNYWQQYVGYSTRGTTAIAQGRVQKLTTTANAQITALNQQKETLLMEYRIKSQTY